MSSVYLFCTFCGEINLNFSFTRNFVFQNPKGSINPRIQSLLDSLTGLQVENAAKLDHQTGLCATHSLIGKKTGVRDIINSDQPETNSGLEYASTVLHVNANSLNVGERFPNALLSFQNLEGVNLSTCGLRSLTGVGGLTRLKYLIVSTHHVEELPEEMGLLGGSLHILDVSSGPLRRLPDCIADLKNLKVLKLFNTLLTSLPEDIGKLCKLHTLDVSSCPIGSLPDGIRGLRVSFLKFRILRLC